jgi:hypothetical protein
MVVASYKRFTAVTVCSAVLFCALCLLPFAAQANISGAVGYSVSRLEKTSDSGNVDTTNFLQKYSILYSRENSLLKGRLGSYNVALGYSWFVADSKRNGDSSSFSAGKLLYRGEIVLAPGGLPFQLTAYRKDLLKPNATSREITDGIFADRVYDGVYDGETVQTGVSLLVGIRNGSYLGRYREVLSQYPRVLMDYKQLDVSSSFGEDVTDFTQKNLAFISLNKKDNWFHFKKYEYTDHVDSRNNSEATEILLGTIDHRNRRHWINLTNWLLLSVDGSQKTYRSNGSGNTSTRWALNNFYRAAYNDVSASAFLSYSRLSSAGEYDLDQTLSIPLSLTKNEYERTWNSRFIFQQREEMQSATLTEENSNVLWTGDVLLNKQERTLIRPRLSLTTKYGDWGEGRAAGAGFDWYSNSRMRPKLSWFLQSDTQFFEGTTEDGLSASYLDQRFRGVARGVFTRRFPWSFTQTLNFGFGEYHSGIVDYMSPYIVQSEDKAGMAFRSESRATIGYTSATGLANKLSASFTYTRASGDNDWGVRLRHTLDYRKKSLSLRTNTFFSTLQSDVDDDSNEENTHNWQVMHSTRVKYQLGRLMTLGGRLNYSRVNMKNIQEQDISLGETVTMHFYRRNLRRGHKMLDLSQGIEFEREENLASGSVSDYYKFWLSAVYHYNRITTLGSRLGYDYYRPGNNQFVSRNWLSINYPLLTMRLAYNYGTNDAGVTEHLYEASVNKKF